MQEGQSVQRVEHVAVASPNLRGEGVGRVKEMPNLKMGILTGV
jgi:hypothetical protein